METLPPQFRFISMVNGYCVTQAIYAAARLGLADLVKKGPRTVEDLARETKANPDHLFRLLRLLSTLEIFRADGERFSLGELGSYLCADTPESLRSMALMSGSEHYQAYGELLHSVKSGETAFTKVYGMPCFDFLMKNPDSGKTFDEAMTNFTRFMAPPLIDAYDFTGVKIVTDVGGGAGTFLAEVLKKIPHVKGRLYDLPPVIERARGYLTQQGVINRCELVGGSFFETVPGGADLYFMKHILHDWSDEQALRILKNIRKVIGKEGKLLLAEMVLTDAPEANFAKLLDLTMMVMAGGRERTEKEWRQLLKSGGFELARIIPSATPVSLIEAVVG